MTHTEFCGPDTLETLMVREQSDSLSVLNWCPKCGAVVVDTQINGRVIPGGVMKMRFPSVAGKVIAMGLTTGERPMSTLPEGDREAIVADVEARQHEKSS